MGCLFFLPLKAVRGIAERLSEVRWSDSLDRFSDGFRCNGGFVSGEVVHDTTLARMGEEARRSRIALWTTSRR
jgi:hypothetical protein